MSMNEEYNEMKDMPEEQFEELRSRLKALPKAKAPVNFTHNLLARIEQMERAESDNVIPLRQPVERPRSLWESFRPAYGIAAAVVIGFIVYELYPVSKRIEMQQAAPEIAQTAPQQSIPKSIMIPPSAAQSELRPAPSTKHEIASIPRRRENVPAVPQDARRADVATRVSNAQSAMNNAAAVQQRTMPHYYDEQAQIMQSAAQLPPDLFRQSRPPSGAQLTTVSSGIMGFRPNDSLNAVDRTPWGAFNALQQGRDSLRIRDSLKAMRHHIKIK